MSEGESLSVEITKCEVIDWWEDERARVAAECRSAVDAMKDRLEAKFAALDKVDLIKPSSEAYDKIKQQVSSDLEMLSRRLQRSIEKSVVASVARSEQQLEDEGMSVIDGLPFVASGAAAAGALGLAMIAGSFATTTGTMLVIIPVTTISWPLFAAFGAGALTLGYFSPRLLEWSADNLRMKYLDSMKAQIENAVFGTNAKSATTALCPQYLAQLDAICKQRMENLT